MSKDKNRIEKRKGYLCIALALVSLLVAVVGTQPFFVGIGVLFFGVAATNLRKRY